MFLYMSVIQSILLDKKHFKNKQNAINYLKKHDLIHSKIDTTINLYRARQIEPKKGYKYAIKQLKPHVKAVIMYR